MKVILVFIFIVCHSVFHSECLVSIISNDHSLSWRRCVVYSGFANTDKKP